MGSRAKPRYPIYVPTKGRSAKGDALTIRMLLRDDVDFRAVVEPAEVEAYEPLCGDHLLVLPRGGMKLLRTRNWIRDHAEAEGYARHWQIDDNIQDVRRLYEGQRIPCNAGIGLRVVEDFSDRYENVGVSGLDYQMFVTEWTPVPYFFNAHVYSCTLINHAMPCRWRLVYNDDTDLCLQALSEGWCTILMNVFMADKLPTMTVKGGNTDDLYGGDGRLRMARDLERQWPGVVTVDRRFQRPQHVVDWKKFDVPLRRRQDFDWDGLPAVDEYGMKLETVEEVKSPKMAALLEMWNARGDENG